MSDHRTCGCSGKPSVGDQRDAFSQLLVAADGFGCVEHLRHAAAFGTFVTDKYGIPFFDLVLQYCVQAFLLTVKWPCPKNGLEHFLRTCGVLDDRALGSQISSQDGNASVRSDGILIGPDDVLFFQGNMIAGVEILEPRFTSLIESVFL